MMREHMKINKPKPGMLYATKCESQPLLFIIVEQVSLIGAVVGVSDNDGYVLYNIQEGYYDKYWYEDQINQYLIELN